MRNLLNVCVVFFTEHAYFCVACIGVFRLGYAAAQCIIW